MAEVRKMSLQDLIDHAEGVQKKETASGGGTKPSQRSTAPKTRSAPQAADVPKARPRFNIGAGTSRDVDTGKEAHVEYQYEFGGGKGQPGTHSVEIGGSADLGDVTVRGGFTAGGSPGVNPGVKSGSWSAAGGGGGGIPGMDERRYTDRLLDQARQSQQNLSEKTHGPPGTDVTRDNFNEPGSYLTRGELNARRGDSLYDKFFEDMMDSSRRLTDHYDNLQLYPRNQPGKLFGDVVNYNDPVDRVHSQFQQMKNHNQYITDEPEMSEEMRRWLNSPYKHVLPKPTY